MTEKNSVLGVVRHVATKILCIFNHHNRTYMFTKGKAKDLQ